MAFFVVVLVWFGSICCLVFLLAATTCPFFSMGKYYLPFFEQHSNHPSIHNLHFFYFFLFFFMTELGEFIRIFMLFYGRVEAWDKVEERKEKTPSCVEPKSSVEYNQIWKFTAMKKKKNDCCWLSSADMILFVCSSLRWCHDSTTLLEMMFFDWGENSRSTSHELFFWVQYSGCCLWWTDCVVIMRFRYFECVLLNVRDCDASIALFESLMILNLCFFFIVYVRFCNGRLPCRGERKKCMFLSTHAFTLYVELLLCWCNTGNCISLLFFLSFRLFCYGCQSTRFQIVKFVNCVRLSTSNFVYFFSIDT